MTVSIHASPDLAGLLAALADNKLFLGRRYAEWCTAAPTLESAVAAAAMAQDEIGHARSLYPVLRDAVGVSSETEPESRSLFDNATFLDEAFQGWTDYVGANFLFDTALSVLLESARDSSFNELATRARRILDEERLHWLHGEGWTRRLAAREAPVRAALQASFDRIVPDCLSWFDIAGATVLAEGVLSATPDELRRRFAARVNPVLQAARLRLV